MRRRTKRPSAPMMQSIKTFLEARKAVFVALACAFATLAALILITPYVPYRLALNRTPSITEGVYLVHRLDDYSDIPRGTLVQFNYRCPRPCVSPFDTYPEGTPFLKHVVGVPGDHINTAGDHFSLDENNGPTISLGDAIRKTPTGRPVPYHAVFAHQVIESGEYFAAGDQEVLNSFDSRYFGLVQSQDITGVAELLWAW